MIAFFKYYLYFICFAFTSGIWLGWYLMGFFHDYYIVLFVMGLCVLFMIGIVIFHHYSYIFIIHTGLLCFLFGILIWNIGLWNHKHFLLKNEYKNIGVHGQLIKSQKKFPNRWNITIRGYIDGIHQPVLIRLVSYTSSTSKKINTVYEHLNRWIYVRVHLFPLHPTFPILSKDFTFYLWAQGYAAMGYTISPLWMDLRYTSSSKNFLETIRSHITGNLKKFINNKESFAIANDLMTGQRTYLENSFVSDYRNSGLAHILAISGLHLGMIALLVIWIVRRVLVFVDTKYDKIITFFIVISILSMFLILVGPAISTLRSFLMIFLFSLSSLLGKRVFSRRSIIYVWGVMLILSPQSLFQMGFLLSFVATSSLILLFEIQQSRRMNSLFQFHSNKKYFFLLRWLIRFVYYVLAVAVVYITILPIFWFFTGNVYLYSMLANIFMIPYMIFIVMPSVLLGYMGILFHLGWILHWESLVIAFMSMVAHEVAMLPYAVLRPLSLPSISFLLWMGGYFWIFLFPKHWYMTLLMLGLGILFFEIGPMRPPLVLFPHSVLLKDQSKYYVLHQQPLTSYEHKIIQRWLYYTRMNSVDKKHRKIIKGESIKINHIILSSNLINTLENVSPSITPCLSNQLFFTDKNSMLKKISCSSEFFLNAPYG